jgi:uncharacterized protein YbjT (DUF2867 family)
MKIAISTPAGHTGRKVVALLQAHGGVELILLARSPEKVAVEKKRGAQVFQGDMWFGDYVKGATKGAQAFFVVVPPNIWTDNVMEHYRRIAQNCADAAKENGIDHVVLCSSIGAQHAEGVGPVKGLHVAEHIIKSAVKNVTVLRSGFYMENLMPQIQAIVEQGKIYGTNAPTTEFAWVATQDIAAAAATALTDKKWKGHRTHQLMTARDYSYNDAAHFLTKALGKRIEYVRASNDDARKWYRSVGFSEHMANEFIEMSEALETKLLTHDEPRTAHTPTPTTLETFCETVIAPEYKKAAGKMAGAQA